MRVAAHGLAIQALEGWDARIARRLEEAAAVRRPAGSRELNALPVLHTADFALPEQRGDFGSGAVERMVAGQAFVSLLEFSPASAGTALFSGRGAPRRVTADAFSPRQLQRMVRGQAGFQHFFTEKGRAFCLYVVVGSFAQRAEVVPRVNAALERIEIEAP